MDVLREVVKSPWFDIGAPLLFDRTGQALEDHPDNVGWLLEMLRRAVGLDALIVVESDPREDPGGEWWVRAKLGYRGLCDGAGSTPCQALARAILALSGKPE